MMLCRRYRHTACLCVLLLLHTFCSAQDTAARPRPWAGFGIEAHLLGGRVFKHEAKFTLPIPQLTTGLDIDLMLHTWGKHEWQQRRGFPTIGLGLLYINYGIEAVYGQCFGIYPNITVPLIRGNKLSWTLRAGDGIGYVTRRYSRTSPLDTINVAIGSKLNDLIFINTDLRYHLNEHIDLSAGAFVTHISNGSFRKPNLGVNVTGATIGITYFPVTSRPAHVVRDLKPLKNRYLVQGRFGMSLVSSYTPGGPLYPIYIGTAYVSRRWKDNNKVFAGVDHSYHTNIYAFLRNNELAPGREAQRSGKSGLFIGNEFLIGRLGVSLQVGAYIQQAYVRKEDVYEKVCGNYYLVQKEHGPIKELFLYAALKTHLNVAEFGELGLGFGI